MEGRGLEAARLFRLATVYQGFLSLVAVSGVRKVEASLLCAALVGIDML